MKASPIGQVVAGLSTTTTTTTTTTHFIFLSQNIEASAVSNQRNFVVFKSFNYFLKQKTYLHKKNQQGRLSWQSSHFQDQRSAVRIQSSVNFDIEHLFTCNCFEKTKIKKKQAGNGPLKIQQSQRISAKSFKKYFFFCIQRQILGIKMHQFLKSSLNVAIDHLDAFQRWNRICLNV